MMKRKRKDPSVLLTTAASVKAEAWSFEVCV